MMKRFLKLAAVIAVAAIPMIDLAQARGENGGGGGGGGSAGGGGTNGGGGGSSAVSVDVVLPVPSSYYNNLQPTRSRRSPTVSGPASYNLCASTFQTSGGADCGHR